MADFAKYPFKKTRDCHSAMARVLSQYISKLTFQFPKSTESFQFAEVYEDWATYNNTATTSGGKMPAAAVLPDRPIYEAASLTPRLLEKTWSGGDQTLCNERCNKLYPIGDGSGDGFALCAIAEMNCAFVILIRASTQPMRRAIISAIEDAFVEDGTLLDPATLNQKVPNDIEIQPIRYGRILTMPDYYDRKARFTLEAHQLISSESSALANRWAAQFEIRGHAPVVVVRRVRAMQPRVRLVVNDIDVAT